MGVSDNKNKYLDLDGLRKYDELIKSYISLDKESLSEDISTIQTDVGVLKTAYISADSELEKSIKEYVNDKVDLKQDAIEDLDAIRSGATAGASALQAVPDEYVTENELTDKKYATTSQVESLIGDAVATASQDDIDNIFNM